MIKSFKRFYGTLNNSAKPTRLYELPLKNASEFPEYDSSDYFKFEVIHQSKKSNARVTKITTPHGVIMQPNFVPVGTVGTVKYLDPISTKETGSQLMFVNTYHMVVNSDPKLIEEVGGLHKFLNYQNPIITDSGGFQVFSLGHPESKNNGNDVNVDVLNKYDEVRELKGMSGKKYQGLIQRIKDTGVEFLSYKNGDPFELGPVSSIKYQKQLGADIIIPFDELPPYHMDENKILRSLHRTHHWEATSLLEHIKDPRKQAIYSVIHGGVNIGMRKQSIDYLTSLPFDGIALGGSLGKDRNEMKKLLENIMPFIPKNKPNHLLGIGDLESITSIIPLGVDSFDSSYPTRSARHNQIIVADKQSSFSIRNQENRLKVDEPLEKSCDCHTCKNYSIAYIHHLLKSHEQIYFTLTTQHNLRAMARLMENFRNKILQDEV
ncbi:hypothetical protein RB653_002377 [Dictyostelium firmibasis]|uniref:tRNA-guanine(15) transglycosylase-like domain-containing protein n=1 Tax=Dictyostelium firmibasis TaxID=79012 RepID=A0AAN7TX48_9MYCE